uniref:PID domain-containing protein n=1 Tax=Rhabditophanes sp. KR3021 TaxID=114890 RepID=A0AC35TG09_9BILA
MQSTPIAMSTGFSIGGKRRYEVHCLLLAGVEEVVEAEQEAEEAEQEAEEAAEEGSIETDEGDSFAEVKE